MENFGLVLFIIAMGFVTAAFVSSFVQPNAQEPDGLVLPLDSGPKIFALFIYCMFAGPYLVARNGLSVFVKHGLPFYMLGGCFIVSTIWSLCSGILIVQLLAIMGVIGVQ